MFTPAMWSRQPRQRRLWQKDLGKELEKKGKRRRKGYGSRGFREPDLAVSNGVDA